VIKLTNKKKYLVTCALPYINSVPHLGNFVPILSADVYSRFLKKQNKNAIYICATDEHGTRTEIEAEKRNITPERYSKQMHDQIKQIFSWFNINFDYFGRTHCNENKEITQDAFLRLWKKGYILEKEITQLYCSKCKKYLPDTYVRGTCPDCSFEQAKGDQCDNCGKLLNPEELINPFCNECKTHPQPKTTKHLFLDLEKLSPSIEKWIKSKKWKGITKNLPLAWIKNGLKPRCITRDLKYGVPVPIKGYENKVFYVWFDAPFGYVAATAQWAKKNKQNWENWWKKSNVEYVQFMGKDNVPFHTLVWPGALLGSGDKWHLTDYIKSNEYLNYENGQFSKSQKIGIFTDDAINLEFSPDVWRFYVLWYLPEKNDSLFSWDNFQTSINSQLVGNLGNFVNRIVTFTKKSFGDVPKTKINATKIKQVLAIKKKSDEALSKLQINNSIKFAFQICDYANQYFQSEEPWKTIKTNKKKCEQTIATCFEILNIISEVFEPFLPETAKKVKDQSKLKNIKIIFNKIETERVTELKTQFSGKQKEKMETKPMIKYDDFDKLDLRVGKIVKVENHPNADKLFKMQVDFGAETKQVLAGIKPYYKPAELNGKQAVFIVNLESRKIRGEISEAMILAADSGKKVVFLTPEKSTIQGAKIQ
jgi:methionyl-tRNA synthetase